MRQSSIAHYSYRIVIAFLIAVFPMSAVYASLVTFNFETEYDFSVYSAGAPTQHIEGSYSYDTDSAPLHVGDTSSTYTLSDWSLSFQGETYSQPVGCIGNSCGSAMITNRPQVDAFTVSMYPESPITLSAIPSREMSRFGLTVNDFSATTFNTGDQLPSNTDFLSTMGQLYFMPLIASIGSGQPATLSLAETPLTLNNIFNTSVSYEIIDLGGEFMTATFSPNEGLSLDEAAQFAGYDHFNWLQIITKDTVLPFISGNFKDQNGNLPSVPYIDPPLGGYEIQADNCGTSLPVRDNLPWYYDEKYDINCQLGGNTILDTRTKDYKLKFFDVPGSPFDVEFLTALVGVFEDGSGEIIDYNGTIFRWGWDSNIDELFGLTGEITQEVFDSFSSEELALIESIPNIRDNSDPNLTIGDFGNLEFIGYDRVSRFSSQEMGLIDSYGIRIRSNAVPEPTTIALVTLGVVGIGFARRKN